jgi:TonB family protein
MRVAALLIVFITFGHYRLCGQGDSLGRKSARSDVHPIAPDSLFVLVSEPQPEFPGGFVALQEFLEKEFKYSHNSPVAGRVYVQFTIDSSGVIKDACVLRGIHPLLDAEAVRVVESMPPWEPVTWPSGPVSTRYNLPIIARTAEPSK